MEKYDEEKVMKKREIKLGVPSYITVESEEGSFIGEQNSSKFEKEDICVEANENGEIWLTADNSPVKTVKLRWNTPLERTSKILGGVWERTYGDAEWKGMSGTRFMPWYFLALNEGVVTGYGVKVRPSAMCFWEADTRGITLVLDVRCGGTGVVLSGRKLLAAEVVAMQADDCTSFEAAKAFCKCMCTDPIFPDFPVYGSNNWYYAYGDSSEKEILQDTELYCRHYKRRRKPSLYGH